VPRPDPTLRAARAALLLVAFMGILGSCGVANGLTAFAEEAVLPAPVAPGTGPGTSEEASEAVARAMADTLNRAPYGRGLAGGNLLVSAMLLVGGTLLFIRRRSAPWWITQAALANGLWTVADATSQIAQLFGSRGELTEVYDRQIEAYLAEQGATAGEMPLRGEHYLWLWVATFAGFALVRMALYAWLAWRVRRPDLRALLVDSSAR